MGCRLPNANAKPSGSVGETLRNSFQRATTGHGRTSSSRMAQWLGFQTLHAGGTPSANQKILCAVTEGKPLLHYFDPKLDAFSDIEQLINRFDLADNQYPGSKFILTWRDLDSWLGSRTRHVERNIQKKQMGKYRGNWLTIDLPAWKQLWHTHYLRVEEYFRGRANHLLKINICAGDGYDALCPFLNRAHPGEPFPWRHRTMER